jgi:phosphoglycolate phosphatase
MCALWVFDLDGTLVDSAVVVASILNEKRVELGRVALPVSEFIPWISLGGEQLVSNALDIPADSVAQHVADFRSRYLTRPTPLESVYPGAADMLAVLGESGRRVALCTNKPRKLTEKVLSETGLDRRIEFICAGDDLPVRKPHADMLNACLRRFSAKAVDAVLVGDSTVDCSLARATGVPFVFFTAGYDDGVSVGPADISIGSHFELKAKFMEGLFK